MRIIDDDVIFGIEFVSGQYQPFVHLSVELEHHLKTLSIKKSKLFNTLN